MLATAAATVSVLDQATFAADTPATPKAAIGYGTDSRLGEDLQTPATSGRSPSPTPSAAPRPRSAM